MTEPFRLHTPETAPALSKPMLEEVKGKLGMIPNLYGVLAGNPSSLHAYLALGVQFDQSGFDATERQVILITASVANGCEYCVAAHTTVGQMQKLDAQLLADLRDGRSPADPKLAAVQSLTRQIVESRGYPAPAQLKAFHSAGYTTSHLLGLMVGVAMKTLSNYVNHLNKTPLDKAFEANRWSLTKPACACSA